MHITRSSAPQFPQRAAHSADRGAAHDAASCPPACGRGQPHRRTIMSLVRWQPFEDIERTMNRMLGGNAWRLPRMLEGENGDLQWQPSANITESDKEYLVRAELPGVGKEDVKVTVENGTITICGERKIERSSKGEKVHRMESFHGTFSRSFSLPADVDEKQIKAESKDGILTVHLPKTTAPATKPVEVKVT
jgi:HSP20 family protein